MDLQIAPVDAVVVGDHEGGQLHILVGQRLQCAVELLEHDVDAAKRVLLELSQFLREVWTAPRLADRSP